MSCASCGATEPKAIAISHSKTAPPILYLRGREKDPPEMKRIGPVRAGTCIPHGLCCVTSHVGAESLPHVRRLTAGQNIGARFFAISLCIGYGAHYIFLCL